MKRVTIGAAWFTLVLLVGCAALGIPQPQTFPEKLAAGYISVTTVRQTATVLLNNDVITAQDGRNIQTSANTVREGLDVARDLYALRPQAGQDKLDATLVILQALQNYVNRKGTEANK